MFLRSIVLAFFAFTTWFGNASADIAIERVPIDNSVPVLLLKGKFSQADNPELLAREVKASGASVIIFDSNGGQVVSAMAYGRMIRSLGLSTLQLRSFQCASACALAFVGGVNREADPGAIGVHQSSFSPDSDIEGSAAVAAIQSMTAEIMAYLIEMGVDPKLLQLSLSVPSDDMRYLTANEMQDYKVTWGSLAALPERVTSAEPTPSTAPSPKKTTSTQQDGRYLPILIKWPNAADFPVQGRFAGKTVLPDFNGRDLYFNNFRTRISEGMREGPNFAGHYTLIQIGCGTGCTSVIVADNNTGRPASFPRGGENNLYLDLDYRLDSRLVTTQWQDYKANTCIIEFFDLDRNTWKPIGKPYVEDIEVCAKRMQKKFNEGR
ncbi:hypothetical protein [Rhizobium sp. CF142]|uniref:COG3904 family protein n=1 Tax=Rhizobium sp. CF142 TaxID=1144314 RepID=UPI00026EE9F1|nr:hypothetical protein [Rhizobium sp. CF142]EJJ28479.1 hypothetical protein PMI11_03207 [Rhizobium sp. CF142]